MTFSEAMDLLEADPKAYLKWYEDERARQAQMGEGYPGAFDPDEVDLVEDEQE